MKVLETTEQANGSVMISLELTEDENRLFIEYAINHMLAERALCETQMIKDYLFDMRMEEDLSNEADEIVGG
jgi:hypothetical protein